MEIVRTISWMKQAARDARRQERVIGLVPTMGALHEGHLSLVREAQKQCSPVIVSIFVNPKQFGPGEDLAKYPRTFEADRQALENAGVDYAFVPPAEEMYPAGFRTSVTVEGLSERLEGRSRPGHFRGVATVVLKLFEIVQPHFAFFGRKDAQQALILRQMASDLNLDAQMVLCPIIREADGLALSSRNAYLKGEERRAATALYRSLEATRREIGAGERDVARLLGAMRSVMEAAPGVALDYAEIVDADRFEPAVGLRKACYALIAARVGTTRLIDNALIEPEGDTIRVTV
ncbi:MAG: pantoate--beta-alanine ligase [Acidobacteriota bacterium]|nr:pantoate--beta-alanine ligase [Acidobacteriota bacterium]MDE3170995.1 pantoate--beta-alanine ligase [Acidobacteriota bacterium]